MNQEQRQQIIDFIPNFVSLLNGVGFSYEQAAEAVHSSLACIFATIWKIPSTVKLSEEEQQLLLNVQKYSLGMFYPKEVRA